MEQSTDYRYLSDCTFFLRGQCAKPHCPYRHFEQAREANVYCEAWSKYECFDVQCPKRHGISPHGNTKPVKSKPICKFFMHGKCTNENCPFLHGAADDGVDISTGKVLEQKAEKLLAKYSMKTFCESHELVNQKRRKREKGEKHEIITIRNTTEVDEPLATKKDTSDGTSSSIL